MKTQVKKRKYILALIVFFFSSCNFFDFDETSALTEDMVFKGIGPQRNFLFNIYSYLPRVDNYIGESLLDCATDDAEYINDFSPIQRFNTGNITVSFNPDDKWSYYYTGIQKCNKFLENATVESYDDYKNNLNPEKDGAEYYPTLLKNLQYLRAEARFLRAFFYFELIKRYGGVPIITRSDSIDFEAKSFHLSRNTFSECVEFIVVELNNIIPELPYKHDTSEGLQGQTGRATYGAAMALKSRVLLYAASPLFNPENDVELWKKAAEAAASLLKEKQYSLEPNYSTLFLIYNSPELILERRMPNSNTFERANFPIGYDGGNTGTCPSQNLVDAYEMKSTGLPISAEGSGYNPDNPYWGRDLRLQETILFNRSNWVGREVQIWDGGLDGPPIQNATKTGYYLKKYLNPNVKIGSGQNITQRHTWYLFRLGEIYLNFAEAMNEAYGPDVRVYDMTARDAVNAIRKRAKMPEFPTGMSKEDFRKKLKNERRVELAFEGHRFWDVRRWGDGNKTFNADLRGMVIEKISTTQYKYTEKVVEKRVFEDKFNLYPIPYSEVVKSNLEQNPGWN
jgi:hypothetical protein